MADESKKTKSTTSHLYDGKTVRSSAPSRKKAAGRMKGNTEIPKDAIPEVHVPSVIESFFGGPIVSKTKFLPPDNMVTSLQMDNKLFRIGICRWANSPSTNRDWINWWNLWNLPKGSASNNSFLCYYDYRNS